MSQISPFALSVDMLNVVMLSVVMLSVVMLSVVAPSDTGACTKKLFTTVIYGFS